MDIVTRAVSAVLEWAGYFIAPHRFSILMLAFALAWGYNFCAPAFKKSSAVRGKSKGLPGGGLRSSAVRGRA